MAAGHSFLLQGLIACGALAAALIVPIGAARAVDHPDLFVMSSPDLADDGMLKPDNAGVGKSVRGPWDCGGKDVSPALAWSHAPAETKSFAIVMTDPDAASGRGGAHWVMYDIPAMVHRVARGEGNDPSSRFVQGIAGRNRTGYVGPCAEPGAKPHHFLILVYALDIAPGTLAKGLAYDALVHEIQGHNLAEASLVARYRRPAPKTGAAQPATAQ
jgi:Raf kinase inhibitor-like YbhB/YbcL family protein